jgi:hypothetical protein
MQTLEAMTKVYLLSTAFAEQMKALLRRDTTPLI